jgi:hypothetical protein
MGWGQKNAQFFCRVKSARMHDVEILSNKKRGVHIEAACEEGCVELELHWNTSTNSNWYYIWLKPWRKTKVGGEPIMIASGELDFDKINMGENMVRLNSVLVEMFRTFQALEVLKEGTDG